MLGVAYAPSDFVGGGRRDTMARGRRSMMWCRSPSTAL